MKFLEVFLSVLGIIAIIAAAAFILIFLVDLFFSIGYKNDGIFFKRKNNANNEVKASTMAEPATVEKVDVERVPYFVEKKEETLEDIENGIDYEAAAREQAEMEKQNANNMLETSEVSQIEDIDFASVEENSKESRIAEILDQYEDILTDVEVEDIEDIEESVEDYNLAEEELEEIKENAEEELDILEAEDEEDVSEEELAEAKAMLASTEAEIEAVKAEKEAAEKLLEERNAEILRLRNELMAAKAEKAEATVTVVGSEEELVARLEVLEERLKENDKNFKRVKREFIPLNNVRKTLDSDKKKLSRKEAIVAKQNVLLYGVNNYVDIDDEKAKKLNEEHELLDGLRMSVRNCEEILEKNKERLPLLENNYNVLRTQNETLKNDIADIKAQLEEIRKNK